MNTAIQSRAARIALGALLCSGPALACADAIVDWNVKAGDLVAESKLGTPPAIRVLAIAHTAAAEAVAAASERQRPQAQPASADAAVAAAMRLTLGRLLPAQQAAIDAAYRTALEQIDESPARAAGIDIGVQAAAAVLARRADDGAATAAAYRPHASPGVYVPTATPAALQWSERRPWLMAAAAEFRPDPPPSLSSAAWARDYREVKAVGARSSAQRSAEQTEIARFWEYSLPSIYHGVVRSVAQMPGRGVAENARLYAAVAQAMDDAMISVFEAKYHYNFWRPITAIRNGDIDGNDATERDPTWTSLIEAPLHPEYPSAHGILAGAVGAVLRAEIGAGPAPVLTTTSPTARGVVRRWTNVDDFVREVVDARVYEGIHFRTSTEVGALMGRRIGERAAARLLQPPH